MYLKQLLSLAAIAGVSATNSHNLREDRMLQLPASIGCIMGGQAFTECCTAADPNDGVCTLLLCINLDDVSVKDECSCGQIETACGQVATLASMVPGLMDMCSLVEECCDDGTTTNDGFNTCMGTAIDNSNTTIPDFASMIPGGIAGAGDNDSVSSTTTSTTPTEPSSETTVAGATEAPADDTGTTEPPAATTVAPAGDSSPAGSESPDGKNDANKYDISTLMSLVGSSLAILFV